MSRSGEFRTELQMPISRQCEVQISFAGMPTSEAMNVLIEYVKLMKQTYQEEEAREAEAQEPEPEA